MEHVRLFSAIHQGLYSERWDKTASNLWLLLKMEAKVEFDALYLTESLQCWFILLRKHYAVSSDAVADLSKFCDGVDECHAILHHNVSGNVSGGSTVQPAMTFVTYLEF